MSRAGQQIEAAYRGAIEHGCPMCSATVGQHCKDEFGRSRRVPCVRRPRIAAPLAAVDAIDPQVVSRSRRADSEPAQAKSEGFRDSACAPIDFSEPRYERED